MKKILTILFLFLLIKSSGQTISNAKPMNGYYRFNDSTYLMKPLLNTGYLIPTTAFPLVQDTINHTLTHTDNLYIKTLRINTTTSLGNYGFQMDQKDGIIYGSTSDGSTNILELKAANTGNRFKFGSGGLALFSGYTATPTVQANTSLFIQRVMIGNDDAGYLHLSRYNSGTPYALILSSQSATTLGSSGFQFISHQSGTQRIGLQLEADGSAEFLNKLYIGSITAANSTLQVGGSLATRYDSTATSLTLNATHHTMGVTATGQTITLPTAASIAGRIYTIVLTATGSCTIATTSSQLIAHATTYTLSAQDKYVSVQSTGANWVVIANNGFGWITIIFIMPLLSGVRRRKFYYYIYKQAA